MKVVVTDSHANGAHFYGLHKHIYDEAGIELVLANCKTDEEVIEACKDADGVVVSFNSMAANVVEKFEKCKIIVRTGVGVDVVDLDACSKKGIFVCNIPDYCMDEVATHAMALMLANERKISIYDRQSRNKGVWDCGYGYKMHRLSNQTLGIIGFSKIGSKFATFAKAFGLNIIASDPVTPAEVMAEFGVKKVEQDELFAQADIISLHLPLNKYTHHLINKDAFAKMKDGVRLINTARGPIICLEDLIEALKSGKVGAVGLDVIENEPLEDVNAEILKFDNVIVTPHAAFQSIEADEQLGHDIAVMATERVLGKIPKNIVNAKGLKENGFLD